MRGYADGTDVSVERSKAELDTLLAKNGASSRGIMADDETGQAHVAFKMQGRAYRLSVPLPRLADFPGRHGVTAPAGFEGWNDAKRAEWRYRKFEQVSRTRWRQVILLVRGKLEAVRLGLSNAEREFMADLVLADGRTVGDVLVSTEGARFLLSAGEGK